MRAYSTDLRKAVLQAIQEGKLTQEEIASLFGVSSRWVRDLKRRWRTTGHIEPRPHGGGPQPKVTAEDDVRILEYLKQHPDAYLHEIKRDCGLSVSLSAVCQALKRLNLPRKKKVPVASERDRPDVQAKRSKWKHKKCQVDANRLHFVDETNVTTRMQRTYGRAPSGQRVYGAIPENHYHTSTVIGSLDLTGNTQTFVYSGGTDNAALTTYVETILGPSLTPGDIVVWDNLPAHKSESVIAAVHRFGCKVWPLPPYSPETNPIEKLWSKVKTFLRGIAARTQESLINGLDDALNSVTLTDIYNWFVAAGYRKMHA